MYVHNIKSLLRCVFIYAGLAYGFVYVSLLTFGMKIGLMCVCVCVCVRVCVCVCARVCVNMIGIKIRLEYTKFQGANLCALFLSCTYVFA